MSGSLPQRALRSNKFNPARKFQSRSKISILRCLKFYSRGPPGDTEKGWIENFNPRSIAQNFQSRRPRSIFFNPQALWGCPRNIPPQNFICLGCFSVPELRSLRNNHERVNATAKFGTSPPKCPTIAKTFARYRGHLGPVAAQSWKMSPKTSSRGLSAPGPKKLKMESKKSQNS